MHILIDLTHPADAHQFRYVISLLHARGHCTQVVARDKEVLHSLLSAWGIPFISRQGYDGLLKKGVGLLRIDLLLLKQIKKFKADILLGGTGNCYIAQAGFLSRKPSVIYDDTEHSRIQNWLTFPFAKSIVTPTAYTLNLRRQTRLNTYKELFYLHPAHFIPDKSIYSELGIKESTPYSILRFVSWGASHDIGQGGIRQDGEKIKIFKQLSTEGSVFITSECPLPAELELHRLKIAPHRLHDALAFARIVVSEGATVAMEAAVLATPTVYCNSLTLGYLQDIQRCYGLVNITKNAAEASAHIAQLLAKDTRSSLKASQKKMLSERIDGTHWLVEHLESLGGAA